MDGSYRSNNQFPENIGFSDPNDAQIIDGGYDENGNEVYYDASDQDQNRTDILKLVLYDLNSAIAPREIRLMAIHAALEEFDHDDEVLHDEELDLRADHILLQKLTYAMCIDPGSTEVGYICSAMESVYRAGRTRLAQSFHEICDALLPLFVEMIRPPQGYVAGGGDGSKDIGGNGMDVVGANGVGKDLLSGSLSPKRPSIGASVDGSEVGNNNRGGGPGSSASSSRNHNQDYDLLNKSTNMPPEHHQVPNHDDDLSFEPNFTPQTDHGVGPQKHYGDFDEESAESVEIPSTEFLDEVNRINVDERPGGDTTTTSTTTREEMMDMPQLQLPAPAGDAANTAAARTSDAVPPPEPSESDFTIPPGSSEFFDEMGEKRELKSAASSSTAPGSAAGAATYVGMGGGATSDYDYPMRALGHQTNAHDDQGQEQKTDDVNIVSSTALVSLGPQPVVLENALVLHQGGDNGNNNANANYPDQQQYPQSQYQQAQDTQPMGDPQAQDPNENNANANYPDQQQYPLPQYPQPQYQQAQDTQQMQDPQAQDPQLPQDSQSHDPVGQFGISQVVGGATAATDTTEVQPQEPLDPQSKIKKELDDAKEAMKKQQLAATVPKEKRLSIEYGQTTTSDSTKLKSSEEPMNLRGGGGGGMNSDTDDESQDQFSTEFRPSTLRGVGGNNNNSNDYDDDDESQDQFINASFNPSTFRPSQFNPEFNNLVSGGVGPGAHGSNADDASTVYSEARDNPFSDTSSFQNYGGGIGGSSVGGYSDSVATGMSQGNDHRHSSNNQFSDTSSYKNYRSSIGAYSESNAGFSDRNVFSASSVGYGEDRSVLDESKVGEGFVDSDFQHDERSVDVRPGLGAPPQVRAFGDSMIENDQLNVEDFHDDHLEDRRRGFDDSQPNVQGSFYDDSQSDRGFGDPSQVRRFSDSPPGNQDFNNASGSQTFNDTPHVQAFDDELPDNQGFNDAPISQGLNGTPHVQAFDDEFDDDLPNNETFREGPSGQGFSNTPSSNDPTSVRGFNDAVSGHDEYMSSTHAGGTSTASQGGRREQDSVHDSASSVFTGQERVQSNTFDEHGGYSGGGPNVFNGYDDDGRTINTAYDDAQSKAAGDYDNTPQPAPHSTSSASGYDRKDSEMGDSFFQRDGPEYKVGQSDESSTFDEHGGYSGGAPNVFKGYDEDGRTINTAYDDAHSKMAGDYDSESQPAPRKDSEMGDSFFQRDGPEYKVGQSDQSAFSGKESIQSSVFDEHGGYSGGVPNAFKGYDDDGRTINTAYDDVQSKAAGNDGNTPQPAPHSTSSASGFDRKDSEMGDSFFQRDGPEYKVGQSDQSSTFDEHGGYSGGAPNVSKVYDEDGRTINNAYDDAQSKAAGNDGNTPQPAPHSTSSASGFDRKDSEMGDSFFQRDGPGFKVGQSDQSSTFDEQGGYSGGAPNVFKGYDEDGRTINNAYDDAHSKMAGDHDNESQPAPHSTSSASGFDRKDSEMGDSFFRRDGPGYKVEQGEDVQELEESQRSSTFDEQGGYSGGAPDIFTGYDEDGGTIQTFQDGKGQSAVDYENQQPPSTASYNDRSNSSFDGRSNGPEYNNEAASQQERESVFSSAPGSGFGRGNNSQFSGDYGNQYSDQMSGSGFPADGLSSNMSRSGFPDGQSSHMSGSGFPDGQTSTRQSDITDDWPDRNGPPHGSMGGGGQGQFNGGWNNMYGMSEVSATSSGPGFGGGTMTADQNDNPQPGKPNPYNFPDPDVSNGQLLIDDNDQEQESKYADFPSDQGASGPTNVAQHEDDIFQFQDPHLSQTSQDYFNYSDPVEDGEICPLAVRKVIKIMRYFSRVLSAMEPLAQQSGLVDALLYHMTKKPHSVDYEDEISSRVDAIAVVVNLACAEENKIMLVYHPGLLDAIINIANHDPIDEAREHAAIVLMNLAYAEENKVHMVNQDHLLDTLVHLLSDVSPFTRRYASAALFTLACTYANTAVMARHCDGGILEALRKVLLNDPIDEARVNAAEALFNMARNNSDDTVENMGNHPRLLASLAHSVLTDYSADVRAYSARALEWLSADIHHPMPCHRILLKALTTASQWTKTTCIAEALKMQASLSENRKPMVEHPGLLDALAALSLLDGITDDEVKTCAISAIERLSKETSTRHIMVKNEGVMTALTKATFVEDGADDVTPEEGTPNALLMKTALKNLAEHM